LLQRGDLVCTRGSSGQSERRGDAGEQHGRDRQRDGRATTMLVGRVRRTDRTTRSLSYEASTSRSHSARNLPCRTKALQAP
jgi:hypothetical protein